MVFAIFIYVTFPTTGNFIFFPEDVWIVTRFLYHLRYRFESSHLKQFLQATAAVEAGDLESGATLAAEMCQPDPLSR